MKNRIRVLGVNFDPFSMDELIDVLEMRIRSNQKTLISFANPEFVVGARHNFFLREYLNKTDYNLADGVGILLAARMYGKRLSERITGTDFTQRLAAFSAQHGYGIYLLGGHVGVAVDASNRLKTRYPECKIAGLHDGYFKPDEEDEIIDAINASNCTFLMVCLGNPKQEEWIDRNYNRLNVSVIFGNGGALDFASGRVSRAPVFMQKFGFEWLWRLFQDFSYTRLRRMMRLPVFVAMVIFDIVNTPKRETS